MEFFQIDRNSFGAELENLSPAGLPVGRITIGLMDSLTVFFVNDMDFIRWDDNFTRNQSNFIFSAHIAGNLFTKVRMHGKLPFSG